MKHEFPDLAHPTKGIASQQFVYRDEVGTPVLIANRYDLPDGGKFFLPYDVACGMWKALDVRPIYNLDKIANADPKTRIILVEGEKCADALTALGYLATTTFGGCNGWKKSDLSPLQGRTVYIWADHDDAGEKYALGLSRTLTRGPTPTLTPTPGRVEGADVRQIPVTAPTLRGVTGQPIDLAKGWDVADFIALGFGREEIDALLDLALSEDLGPLPQSDPTPDENTLPRADQSNCVASEGSSLLDGLELWKTPQDETYATLRRNGHFEHWPTTSKTFRNYLSFTHYQAEGKAPSATVLEDRKRAIEGLALFEGETHLAFTRVAVIGRTLFLDLGDAAWQAVAITAEGWQVVTHPQARFRRSPGMQALPIPERHSQGLEPLRAFLNVSGEDDFRMLVSWLLGCFHPHGPYPDLTEDAHSFPRQENKLSNALRRVQPPLRRRGVSISFRRDGKQGARVIEITSA